MHEGEIGNLTSFSVNPLNRNLFENKFYSEIGHSVTKEAETIVTYDGYVVEHIPKQIIQRNNQLKNFKVKNMIEQAATHYSTTQAHNK